MTWVAFAELVSWSWLCLTKWTSSWGICGYVPQGYSYLRIWVSQNHGTLVLYSWWASGISLGANWIDLGNAHKGTLCKGGRSWIMCSNLRQRTLRTLWQNDLYSSEVWEDLPPSWPEDQGEEPPSRCYIRRVKWIWWQSCGCGGGIKDYCGRQHKWRLRLFFFHVLANLECVDVRVRMHFVESAWAICIPLATHTCILVTYAWVSIFWLCNSFPFLFSFRLVVFHKVLHMHGWLEDVRVGGLEILLDCNKCKCFEKGVWEESFLQIWYDALFSLLG